LYTKRAELSGAANKLKSGLGKIEDTRIKVQLMSIELEEARVKVKQFQNDCDDFLVTLVQQKREADDQQKVSVGYSSSLNLVHQMGPVYYVCLTSVALVGQITLELTFEKQIFITAGSDQISISI